MKYILEREKTRGIVEQWNGFEWVPECSEGIELFDTQDDAQYYLDNIVEINEKWKYGYVIEEIK